MEKTEVKLDSFAEYAEWYLYLLLPALALLAIWIVLINTRYLEVP